MALARARRFRTVDYWPGFVDALSTMLLMFTFLISVFMMAQFFLSPRRHRQGRRAAAPEPPDRRTDLRCWRSNASAKTDAQSISAASPPLCEADAQGQSRPAEPARSEAMPAFSGAAQSGGAGQQGARSGRNRSSARALAQIDILNQQIAALRRQLSAIEEALAASELPRPRKPGENRRPRLAPQRRAGAEGAGARALPLGFLRPIASNSRQSAGHSCRRRPLRVPVGSAVRFRQGGASIPPAAPSSIRWPMPWVDLEREIPTEIQWVLRVDGHTDKRPIPVAAIPFELGAVGGARDRRRAISRSRRASSPQHLVAAGFGEFQPLDVGENDEAYRRNRRIELKLTER